MTRRTSTGVNNSLLVFPITRELRTSGRAPFVSSCAADQSLVAICFRRHHHHHLISSNRIVSHCPRSKKECNNSDEVIFVCVAPRCGTPFFYSIMSRLVLMRRHDFSWAIRFLWSKSSSGEIKSGLIRRWPITMWYLWRYNPLSIRLPWHGRLIDSLEFCEFIR